jgi:hypothetical protein
MTILPLLSIIEIFVFVSANFGKSMVIKDLAGFG